MSRDSKPVEIPSSTGTVGVGKKINKGKCSRVAVVDHGQRRVGKESPYAKGKQMAETLKPSGTPVPAVKS